MLRSTVRLRITMLLWLLVYVFLVLHETRGGKITDRKSIAYAAKSTLVYRASLPRNEQWKLAVFLDVRSNVNSVIRERDRNSFHALWNPAAFNTTYLGSHQIRCYYDFNESSHVRTSRWPVRIPLSYINIWPFRRATWWCLNIMDV